ncbi:hydrolase [Streptomyces mashuensis]|uniref:Hydrolase n=1 Tax=Streptomyces mashuensis TaxID=33904 RepID=A0A919B2H6_9ACTN|nr:glycoside hydrolase family 16 protein [Streptomyces mashuensis]GHF45062.1 hydrolase [Streptomyces mashuensis]
MRPFLRALAPALGPVLGPVLSAVPAVLVLLLAAFGPQGAAAFGPQGAAASGPQGAAASGPGGWRLVWADEFTGPAHRRPDAARWVYDRGGEPQWGNHEWQYYTDRPANVSLDGQGNLAITARHERLPGMHCASGPCDITSGRITTKGRFARTYGRFEARIKVPGGKGTWPAFWMMGADIDRVRWPGNGEIDVMEVLGREPGTAHGSVHGPGYAAQGVERHTDLGRGRSLADDFHVYRVDWERGRITWYLDGRPYGSVRADRLGRGRKWVSDHPHYLLLNLAVGGDWPGPPDRTTRFPARLLVDYVRVYAPA